jgi:hypothetical protein
MSAAKLIFAKAICQPEGKSLIIHCKNFNEAERLRIGLYRERTKLENANPTLAARLVISRRQADNSEEWLIEIGAQEPSFTVTTEDGEPVDIYEGVCAQADLDDIERRLKLMKEDGYSDEQLEKERQAMLEDLKGNDTAAD